MRGKRFVAPWLIGLLVLLLHALPAAADPAAYQSGFVRWRAADAAVQRTYLRSELEVLWLASSGGAVYLVYPPDRGPAWPW